MFINVPKVGLVDYEILEDKIRNYMSSCGADRLLQIAKNTIQVPINATLEYMEYELNSEYFKYKYEIIDYILNYASVDKMMEEVASHIFNNL